MYLEFESGPENKLKDTHFELLITSSWKYMSRIEARD